MRRVILALLLAAAHGMAQRLIDPSRVPASMLDVEDSFREPSLECQVTPFPPALNFNFRFQAGYVFRVPMAQYFGPKHMWVVLLRITPESGAAPVYLGGKYRLPDVPHTTMTLQVGGGYFLGEGRYHVAWKLYDDLGRTCRKTWTIDAHLSHGDRKVKVSMPPGTAADLALHGIRPAPQPRDDAPPIRLTVLMHAAPANPMRTRLGARDRILLLGALSSLLERVPLRSVRLVVFNLDQQKEIFRQDSFEPGALDQVAEALDALELNRVDYSVLKDPSGDANLLTNLIHGELTARAPPDVVLFLGPEARTPTKLVSPELAQPRESPPRFLYLQYRPWNRDVASVPDIIAGAVGKLKGKTFIIRTPADFAKAIAQVEQR